jgi:CHAD domain-containing protein
MSNIEKDILEEIRELKAHLGDAVRQYVADMKMIQEYIADINNQIVDVVNDVKQTLQEKERILRSNRGR